MSEGRRMRKPRISVVICTHNRYDVLPDALASMQEQSLAQPVVEVLVLDNSTDIARQSEFWAADGALAGNCRLIIDKVPGLSRARNRGVRGSSAPVVAFMDDDAIADRQWCEAIVEAFDQCPDAGIVGGPVDPIWPCSEPNWLHRWQRGFLTILNHGDERRPLKQGEWLAGTNIAFLKEAIEAAGGFNEALGRVGGALLSNEELELAKKIAAAGRRSYYEPRAKMLHRVHADRVSQAWLRRRVCWQAVSDALTGATPEEPDQSWSKISAYLMSQPPQSRSLASLFSDTPNSEAFYQQCQALEAFLRLSLQCGQDPAALL